MKIDGVPHIHSAHSLQGPHRTEAAQASTSADAWMGVDELEISPEADLVSQVHDLPEIRADRVAEIRAEIASGAYETDEKLELAVGRLFDEIG